MKYLCCIFLSLLFLPLLFLPSFSHSSGFIFQKQVNGDYKSSLVANFRPAGIPSVFLNTSANFVSPRSQALAFNHENFEALIGASFILFGGNLELSTGFSRYWGGNSRNLPDGFIESNNAASLIWTF